IILKRKNIPFLDLYSNNFAQQISKSEFASCIRDLKTEKFIDYEGNFDDTYDIVLTRFGEEIIKKHNTFSNYLESKSNETLYDRIVKWGKNNIIIVTLLLVFSVFAALGSFSDSFRKLFSKESVTINSDSISYNLKKTASKADTIIDTLPQKDLPQTKKETIQVPSVVPTLKTPSTSTKSVKQKFESQLCNDVLLVVNNVSENFKNIKGNRTSSNVFITTVNLPGSISNEITNYNNNYQFSSIFYRGTPAKAGATYNDLIDELVCFGKAEAAIKDNHWMYQDINYNDKIIRIYLNDYKDENNTYTECVSLIIKVKS